MQIFFKCSLFSALLFTTIICLMPIDHEGPVNHFDKIVHTSTYFILGLLAWLSYPMGIKHYSRHFGLLVLFGVLIEVAQGQTEYRSFSLLDMAANASGVALFWLLLVIKARLNTSTD